MSASDLNSGRRAPRPATRIVRPNLSFRSDAIDDCPQDRRWQSRAGQVQTSLSFVGAKRKRVCYKAKELLFYDRETLCVSPTVKGRFMPKTTSDPIDESTLTKGQRRKLNALRKSVGNEIGEQAFAVWLSSQKVPEVQEDGNAVTIADTLWPMIQQGNLAIPRGGYLLRRGRGRVIVEKIRP